MPRAALALATVVAVAATAAGPVLVTSDRAQGHAEPDVAVNPRNAQNLVGACQFVVASRTRLPGTFASFDGGRTWHDNGLLPLPGGFDQGADTTVAFDRAGNGFVAALLAEGGGGYASRVARGGIFLWKTTDDGRSFSPPRPVYVGRGFQDHPWLAIRGSTLYLAWTNSAGLLFSASPDDGRTFSRPRVVVAGRGPQDPVVTLGPRRELRVFFQEFVPGRTRLAVALSRSGGASFLRPRAIASVPTVPASGSGPKGGIIPPPLLGAAGDRRSGAAAVAIAEQDARAGHPVIELWRTDTRGRWTGPFRPAAGFAANLAQTQPRLAFSGSSLFVSYFTVSRAGDISAWLARWDGGGDVHSRGLSTTPFRFGGWLGDYQALAVAGGSGYALWNAARSGRLGIFAARFRAG